MCRYCVAKFMDAVDTESRLAAVPDKASIAADFEAIIDDVRGRCTPEQLAETVSELKEHSPLWWRDLATRDRVIERVLGCPPALLSSDMLDDARDKFGDAIFFREVARGLRNLHVLMQPN